MEVASRIFEICSTQQPYSSVREKLTSLAVYDVNYPRKNHQNQNIFLGFFPEERKRAETFIVMAAQVYTPSYYKVRISNRQYKRSSNQKS